ncbi:MULTISPECIES: NAD(P)/FAD-dependent oxidoreductase [Methanoculleus]|uniref:Geranylgeranyl reductase family n=1 Tax=Methanoculleus thermophilus TaxID=2200 RepID=A0A1G9BQ03_9EURY|nr:MULTISPECIES: NAD(P)/FAD-dependent oxidoreductase [Methanoculleus]SDK41537.1 geranylgeranyl reductase family [Methanoculleus thermophilus]HQD25377.1 NAD(P)/FAD-dependent oxidoreductase [Methanoculleus thermophilus]
MVGAGPAGSAAARACAEEGLSTLCIEEHGTIGYPVQCAGLLSASAFAECDVSKRSVLNEVTGARMFSGLGGELLFDAGVTKAYVVDRCLLDREMAENAANAGAEFCLKTSACGIRGTTLLARGVCGREEIPFRLLIAADGPRSSIARMLGLQRAETYLAGVQAEVPHEMDPRYVELHPNASPDFFGWVIPVSETRARVGLCAREQAKDHFDRFIARYGDNILHLVSGVIPLGVMPQTYGHRALFVGDAAGFAKPTSGGGVYTGVRSAKHAAAVAAACVARMTFDDESLRDYERRWKKDFGRELDIGMKALRMRQRMTPEEIDRLCRALNDEDLIATIVEHGDMDRPGALLRKLALKPALARAMGILFASGVRQILTG